ncbi:hypothetical protein LZ31DRAFT_539300 [Colletotrichum somersetense]|nr:hypothetical protein LZ31DRAFT_539300 [Colletotrichum somersetense]
MAFGKSITEFTPGVEWFGTIYVWYSRYYSTKEAANGATRSSNLRRKEEGRQQVVTRSILAQFGFKSSLIPPNSISFPSTKATANGPSFYERSHKEMPFPFKQTPTFNQPNHYLEGEAKSSGCGCFGSITQWAQAPALECAPLAGMYHEHWANIPLIGSLSPFSPPDSQLRPFGPTYDVHYATKSPYSKIRRR